MEITQHGDLARSCHMCSSKKLTAILDLGYHPPSDAFLRADQLNEPEASYPLRLITCRTCGLLQVDYKIKPEILYKREYPYESSTTNMGRNHYHSMAREICEKFAVSRGSLVIDIGSNVGVLLAGFKNLGMDVLGIDPADGAAKKAIANGIDTIIDFFDEKLAGKLKTKYGMATIITGTNVFAHIYDLSGSVRGMKRLLAKNGVISIEAPYAVELIKNLEYDTIYHEHIGYLSVKPMARFFKRFGLELFDVQAQNIHGGSLRYYVGHSSIHPVTKTIKKMINEEEKFGLYSVSKLRDFAEKVVKHKIVLKKLIVDLKKAGKSVIGISAPAKGNTLLNYCGLDFNYIDFLTEKTKVKIGRFSPGTHIPVLADEQVMKRKPDYAIVLAWNFAEEIMKNMSNYKKAGGKFIIPIPNPKII